MDSPAGTPMRVLLAADGSARDAAVESWVVRARWRTRPLVDILAVAGRGVAHIGHSPLHRRDSVRVSAAQLRSAELLAAQRVANEMAIRLQASGLATRSWSGEGEAAHVIARVADRDRPDVVAVPSRGDSVIGSVMFGRLERRLTQDLGHPVLVSRVPADEESDLPRRIVVVAGTVDRRASIRWMARAGWLDGADTLLLDLGTTGERDLEEFVAATAAPANVRMLAGPWSRAVVDAVRRFAPDLVAATRPSGHRLESFSAELARRSSASVLIVPGDWNRQP